MTRTTAPTKPAACPACGIPSVLVREIDRYVHLDGTSNRRCWLATVRGEQPLHGKESR